MVSESAPPEAPDESAEAPDVDPTPTQTSVAGSSSVAPPPQAPVIDKLIGKPHGCGKCTKVYKTKSGLSRHKCNVSKELDGEPSRKTARLRPMQNPAVVKSALADLRGDQALAAEPLAADEDE